MAMSWQALWTIPRMRSTIFKENTFHSISYGRLLLLATAHLVRFTLACMLYVSGVQWLAATTSIVDLILNSVALVLILEIDEFLFAALVPMNVQLAIENLEPIKATTRDERVRWRSLADHDVYDIMIYNVIQYNIIEYNIMIIWMPLFFYGFPLSNRCCKGFRGPLGGVPAASQPAGEPRVGRGDAGHDPGALLPSHPAYEPVDAGREGA